MRWKACRRLSRKRRGQKMTSRTSPDVSPSLVDMLSPLQRPCCLTGRFIQPSTSDVVSWCDSQGRDRVSPVSSSILNTELEGLIEPSRSNSRDVRRGVGWDVSGEYGTSVAIVGRQQEASAVSSEMGAPSIACLGLFTCAPDTFHHS